jgi:RNA polymerase sigma-70 factor (ECF subfamily)
MPPTPSEPRPSLAGERDWMRRRARRLLGPKLRRWADSEDVAQQAQLDAARQIDGRVFASQTAFRGWLGRILRNRVIELARRRGHADVESSASRCADSEGGPATRCAERDEALALHRRLAKLPERERRVVLLRVVEGLPFAEVGARVGVAEGHARVIFNRVLASLRLGAGAGGDEGIV